MRNLLKALACSSIVLLGMSLNALAVPGDYDADGKSDLSVALVDRSAGTTAWLTRLTNGATPLFWTFPKAADALVAGRFYSGDAKYYPAIVYVKSTSVPLEWIFKTPNGSEINASFGLPGDIITNLGDWDGDGREDRHVVRKGATSELDWYVFLTGYAVVVKVSFGLEGDQVGVADTDGDGQIELIALRNNYLWYVRKPFADANTTVSTQWGLNGDIPLLPKDLNGDNLADFIISRKVGAGQVAYIKYSNGQSGTIPLGFSDSIPQVGDFGTNMNFAWSQRDTGWTAIRNPDGTPNVFRFGIPTNAIVRADGSVVQPTSTGIFPATSSTPPPSSGGGSIASCSSTITSGWLLKPASQDTNDSREGKPLVLFSRNYPSTSCLSVLATNGTVIAKYGRFTSNRYYIGYGCGTNESPGQLAAKAVAASGSKNITLLDPNTGTCYGSGPADGRTDRR